MIEQPEDKIEQGVMLAVIVFVCVLVVSLQCRAEGYSVTVHAAVPSERYSVTVHEQPKAAAKPVVYLYSQAGCQPCIQAKAEFAAATDLPFRLITNQKPNIQIDGYPCLHWNDSSGNGKVATGWTGLERFIATWQETQSQSDPSRTSGASSTRITASINMAGHVAHLKQFAASYRGPMTNVNGSTKTHLMEAKHGFTASDLEGLTEWHLERLHSAMHHYGWHARDLREYAKRKGLVP